MNQGSYIDFVVHVKNESRELLLTKKDDTICLIDMAKYHVVKKKPLGIAHGARACFIVDGKAYIAMKDRRLVIMNVETLEVIWEVKT